MSNDATVKFGYDGTALNRGLAQQEGKLKRFASSTENSFRGAQAAIGTLGLGLLAREGVQVVAAFDRMNRGMTSLEGSAAGAKLRMDELREASKLPGLDFEQAVQGDIRLRSVGLSAELSKKAITEMGNALSLAGGTSADLDGVVLALTQIISKGKVSAEEINQIAERVPQVRAVMKDMFGTADTETLQRMNIDAETFVSTLVEGFGKLERAQAGLDEKMQDFSTSIRGATNALLEGLVGKGAEGLSRLGGLLDQNNDKLRQAGQFLGDSASGVADWFVNAGDAIGFMASDLMRAISYMGEVDGLTKYQEETQGILELMQAQKDSIELEKIRVENIKAATEARQTEIKAMELPKSVLENDPIRKAGEEADKPVSKEQQALDERKRKLAEAELPIKERIAAIEERIAEQRVIVANAAVTLNLTEKERIANEMKLLDLQEEAAALKRQDAAARPQPVATAAPRTASTPNVFTPPRVIPETRGSMPAPFTPEEGYDENDRRITDGRKKIRGVQTPDTYTGGSIAGPFRPLSQRRGSLTPGGGLNGFYARQNVGSGSGSMSISTSTTAVSATTAAQRGGDQLSAKIDRTNELLSRGLLGQ
jgi:tape measure domain-containing protein